MNTKKAALVILDGWGIGKHDTTDAIWNAKTPFTASLAGKYPTTTLLTCGEAVGLPEGQMGNSEVGHLNLGAGRVVYQMLVRINRAFRDGSIAQNAVLQEIFSKAKGKKLHLIGLVSDGGVHSHISHFEGLAKLAADAGLEKVFIHAFTDGRDTDPRSGLEFIRLLETAMAPTPVRIASVVGRYFAMDRDKRWERVKKAFDLLTEGKGNSFSSATEAISASYNAGITDEFIEPAVITRDGQPLATIQDGDVVLCVNFRTDRCRQITQVLTQMDLPNAGMQALNLEYYTMTEYDREFRGVKVLFDEENLRMTMGEVIAEAGLKQLRAAETEKYPHVTFFFSGGREEPFPGEERIMVASPKVATYDLQPEMSAPELTEKMVEAIRSDRFDFICLNFANPDMVGHTGVFEAIIRAVETVDACLEKVVTAGLEHGFTFMVIADHGNADEARNPDGSPNTQHSLNPVPCWLVGKDTEGIALQPGKLADVSPTLLKVMGIAQPAEMNGKTLY